VQCAGIHTVLLTFDWLIQSYWMFIYHEQGYARQLDSLELRKTFVLEHKTSCMEWKKTNFWHVFLHFHWTSGHSKKNPAQRINFAQAWKTKCETYVKECRSNLNKMSSTPTCMYPSTLTLSCQHRGSPTWCPQGPRGPTAGLFKK